MASLQCILQFGKVVLSNCKPRHTKLVFMACALQARDLSTMEVTKNIVLLSKEKKNNRVDNFKLVTPEERPLTVLLSWLMAKKKHVRKYANFYIDNGFDVLNISISPWQLLWPTKGTQVVASDILKFLHTNPSYSPLVLHGFSVGGYLWSEVMVHMAAEREKYKNITDRIVAQVWDSAADITEMPVGMPIAVFPRNTVMQNALRQYILYHLRAFDKVATCHYIRASQMFHTNIVNAPALFFLSKSDPIGAERSNLRVKENWENMGIEVCWKCFENTPHVGHMQHYPKEYIAELTNFMEKTGAFKKAAEQLQAKL